MTTGLRLWNSAYYEGNQIITKDKMVLYSRSRTKQTFKTELGIEISVSGWSSWYKSEEPRRMEKSWHVKELTVDDLIMGLDNLKS